MDEAAESFNGAAHTFVASTAKRYRTNLVATVSTKLDDRDYNLGVLYGRDGDLAGSYRKVHIPDGEKGIALPGNDYPVFEIEGLTVGMQICHDLNFQEGCRILATRGADIIFWPNQWGGMPEVETDVLMRARAIENRVCPVSSAWVLTGDPFFRAPKIHGRSCVVDWDGTILAEVGIRVGAAVTPLDIDEVERRREGRKQMLKDERRPETYGLLVR